MNIIGILIIVMLIVSMVIGCIVGLVKGFTNVKSWGVEFLLASAVSIGIGGIFSQAAAVGGEGAISGGIVTIIVAVVSVVAFTFLFKLFRLIFKNLINSKIAKAAETDEEDSDEEDEDDQSEKRKKPSTGFVGFLNRALGGITVALQCFVIVGFVSALLLFALDVSQFAFVTNYMGEIYSSATYASFKSAFMDLFIVGVIMASIKCGFNSGISGALWSVVVIGLVAFSLLAAYHLAFNIPAFQPAIDKIAGVIATEGVEPEIFQTVAKAILTAGLFVVMLVAVMLIAIFGPKIFGGLRDNKIFYVIDGVFGGICATVLVLGILLAVGMVLQPITDLEFMSKLTSYFEESKIATYFYDNDLIALYGVQIPIREWVS